MSEKKKRKRKPAKVVTNIAPEPTKEKPWSQPIAEAMVTEPKLEPAPAPKKPLPEPPEFVKWTYGAQEIEDFRVKYKEFTRLYNEARGK